MICSCSNRWKLQREGANMFWNNHWMSACFGLFSTFLLVRNIVEHTDICMPLCKQLAVGHQVLMSIMDRFNYECFAVVNEYWISALAKFLYNECVSEKQVRSIHTRNGKSRWRFQMEMHLRLRCPQVSSAHIGSASIWDHIPILTCDNSCCGWACHFHSDGGAAGRLARSEPWVWRGMCSLPLGCATSVLLHIWSCRTRAKRAGCWSVTSLAETQLSALRDSC